MFTTRFTSRIRQLEAEQARANRREIVKALGDGQITKRDLVRWGILSAGGALVLKNGLSAFATSAYASVPTGTPRTDLKGAKKFEQPLPRPYLPERYDMKPTAVPELPGEVAFAFHKPGSPHALSALPSMRTSYHTLHNRYPSEDKFRNPVTHVGPIEGRPPQHPSGDYFAHQRWGEFAPKAGYILSMGQIKPNQRMHPRFAELEPNSVWSWGPRVGNEAAVSPAPSGFRDPSRFEGAGYYGRRTGYSSPPLIQARYGEPIITRIHNDLPVDRSLNGGFGRNEISTHNHNAHNAAESDGASNAYHFPGTFYDYHWSTVLARHDASQSAGNAFNANLRAKMTRNNNQFQFQDGHASASTIDDNGKPRAIPGDFREIQSSLWFHDHRFFFTAENVQKGMYGLINMYSGPDCGNEAAGHAGALRLPSGTDKPWGNLDFDINLAITNPALDRRGQLAFDIFDTDGYLGDMLCVNGAYCPYQSVLQRRYRFRILNAAMSRFLQLMLVDQSGNPLPFHVIANDGNLLPKPVLLLNAMTTEIGNGERLDIVVDFDYLKRTKGITRAYLVNVLYHKDGRKPEGRVSIGNAMRGVEIDPAVGPFLEFRIGDKPSRDDSANFFEESGWKLTGNKWLTRQIPVVAPDRERVFYFGRADVDARENGVCTPDCGEAEKFPWAISVNGQSFHAFNAARASVMVPSMGDVEHWRLVNNSGGWDHPVHLHFEEGVTIGRGKDNVPATERLARKDVWRLGRGGEVKVQLRFSEFAGAYVQHCHNTTHEDFSMILRVQVLGYVNGQPQVEVTPTPLPTAEGVVWKTTAILREGEPDFVHTGPPEED